MQPTTAFVIPPNGQVTRSDGGDHLMLEQLRRVPKEGEQVMLNLTFEGYAPMKVTVPVKRL